MKFLEIMNSSILFILVELGILYVLLFWALLFSVLIGMVCRSG